MHRALLAVFAFGCGGSSPTFTPFDAGDATTNDAPTWSFSDASIDVSTPDVPDIALDAAGAFLCEGCICDGTKAYCYDLWVGAPGDGGVEPQACAMDGGSHCTLYPPDCASNPTCGCILNHMCPNAQCALDPSGSGFDVECTLP